MTRWDAPVKLTTLQETWLCTHAEQDGSYDILPEKYHLIPYVLLSKTACSCEGTACIKCIGGLFNHANFGRSDFVPRNAPIDKSAPWIVRRYKDGADLGAPDLFAATMHELIRAIGQILLLNETPVLHQKVPLLNYTLLRTNARPRGPFTNHVISLDGGVLVPPWRPDVTDDTVTYELMDLRPFLEVPKVVKTTYTQSAFSNFVGNLRTLGFKYVTRRRLGASGTKRALNPPSKLRAYLEAPVNHVLNSLKKVQHERLPLRVFTVYFQDEVRVTLAILWRSAPLKAVTHDLSVNFEQLSHQEILRLRLAPDLRVAVGEISF